MKTYQSSENSVKPWGTFVPLELSRTTDLAYSWYVGIPGFGFAFEGLGGGVSMAMLIVAGAAFFE